MKVYIGSKCVLTVSLTPNIPIMNENLNFLIANKDRIKITGIFSVENSYTERVFYCFYFVY